MNQKTAKLLNRYARALKMPTTGIKQLWKSLSHRNRGKLRPGLERRIVEAQK